MLVSRSQGVLPGDKPLRGSDRVPRHQIGAAIAIVRLIGPLAAIVRSVNKIGGASIRSSIAVAVLR